MLYALKRGIKADAFVIDTDSETWAGAIHPVQALRMYRQQTGIAAKLPQQRSPATAGSVHIPVRPGLTDAASGQAQIRVFTGGDVAKQLKTGDKVSWSTPQGKTEGTVERRVTSTTKVKGHTAKPTRDAPEYVVKSAKSGKQAVHKPEALKKI